MAGVGIITGLASEAACFGDLPPATRPPVRCHGIGADGAARAARALLARGCEALASFGLAAGLDPTLAAGTVVLGTRVVAAGGDEWPTDGRWRQATLARLGGALAVVEGVIAAAPHLLSSPAAKRALRDATDGIAADMESQGVAAVATEQGCPFLVVRCIADPADAELPAWLAGGVTDGEGRIRPGAIAAGLIGAPASLGSLLRLARASATAHASLRRVAARLGPGFGLFV